MKYQWILFDADETLFHFHSLQGLQTMLARYDVAFDEQDYAAFQAVNQPLWVRYQQGEIDMNTLAQTRFAAWSARLNRPALALNDELQLTMAHLSAPLQGAREVLAWLHENGVKLGIITNGFAKLQQPRLAHTGFAAFFDVLVISELESHPKPHRAIFTSALQRMGNPPPEQVLMVGDTLASDILGGNRVGMATCWLNTNNKPNTTDITPTFTVRDWTELGRLLGFQAA